MDQYTPGIEQFATDMDVQSMRDSIKRDEKDPNCLPEIVKIQRIAPKEMEARLKMRRAMFRVLIDWHRNQ